MFARLLWESFARQRRRKALAGIAILLGTTAVTAMLALATTIGDRIHRELAVYGANIVVFPKADSLSVQIAGQTLKPATGGAYLHESDLARLKTIFWANNITGISPELPVTLHATTGPQPIQALGLWFQHPFGNGSGKTGAPQLHPAWKIHGSWPAAADEAVVGSALAQRLGLQSGQALAINDSAGRSTALRITGILSTGDAHDTQLLLPLETAQNLANFPNDVSRIEISARTKPEDAFARMDPDSLSPAKREIWYCRPYANSIAYQIAEAIPGSRAEQVRQVEQTEGTLLNRISGLMWLVSAAALLAAGFAVSAAMATAVLERRGEIGLMRSLGAGKARIAMLFYAESGLLAVIAGTLGFFGGSLLAYWLGAHIFSGAAAGPVLNAVLLPVVLALALFVAVAGSTPSIRSALRMDPSAVLRGDR